MILRLHLIVLLLLCAGGVGAQGQDSAPWDRDLQVVAAMLAGGFDNANQSYFDLRGDRSIKHRRYHIDVDRIDAPALGEYVFFASSYWDSDEQLSAGDYLWILSADDDAQAVRMETWRVATSNEADTLIAGTAIEGKASCDVLWRREAAQFRGTVEMACEIPMPDDFVLSAGQLWVTVPEVDNGSFQMNRIRNFECYADIPGVGGGRDIPYDRYEDIRIHDQGGAAWFTSKEGRRLGVSLFLVDWPINNYEGIFTRDSFVIYVSEEIDGERKEHGYAFTIPEADRIGINLKWMLASCFMKSNRFATPAM
ncbi:MAG: hypothetical protein OEQ74_09470 [Gammaproteobacteria bacterium]|nr:hypothetical protein [Gammaproteobacteria bacterium]